MVAGANIVALKVLKIAIHSCLYPLVSLIKSYYASLALLYYSIIFFVDI